MTSYAQSSRTFIDGRSAVDQDVPSYSGAVLALLPSEFFGVWISVEANLNADDKPDIVLGLANWPRFVPSDWTTRPIMEGRNGEAATITFLLNDH